MRSEKRKKDHHNGPNEAYQILYHQNETILSTEGMDEKDDRSSLQILVQSDLYSLLITEMKALQKMIRLDSLMMRLSQILLSVMSKKSSKTSGTRS